jgi:hypothetical protein
MEAALKASPSSLRRARLSRAAYQSALSRSFFRLSLADKAKPGTEPYVSSTARAGDAYTPGIQAWTRDWPPTARTTRSPCCCSCCCRPVPVTFAQTQAPGRIVPRADSSGSAPFFPLRAEEARIDFKVFKTFEVFRPHVSVFTKRCPMCFKYGIPDTTFTYFFIQPPSKRPSS